MPFFRLLSDHFLLNLTPKTKTRSKVTAFNGSNWVCLLPQNSSFNKGLKQKMPLSSYRHVFEFVPEIPLVCELDKNAIDRLHLIGKMIRKIKQLRPVIRGKGQSRK